MLYRFSLGFRGQGASENVDLAKVVSLAVYRLYVALFFKNGVRTFFLLLLATRYSLLATCYLLLATYEPATLIVLI